jgi:hypothetical protein
MASGDEDENRGKKTRKVAHAGILACALALSAIPARAADDEASFGAALGQGRPILELRPRYNRIDESDREERTEGTTYRIIAGWRTAPWRGLRLTLEGINTGHIGLKEFNDDPAQFFSSEYPLLPDPGHTGVNQAYVEYMGIDAWRIRAGRSRVRLGNQRWVSDNDFRQIPQLFDGAEVTNTSMPRTELLAAHYRRMRDTSGNTLDLRLTLLQAAYNPAPGHALAAFAVYHDQPVTAVFTGLANSSYRVVGARAEGAFSAAGEFAVPYTAEIAQQRAYAGGSPLIDARYWRAGAGIAWRDVTVRYDYEVKGSNGGRYGVQMPLTDFYAYNGWTLHFFATPPEGLRDEWVTVRCAYPWPNVVLYGEGHRFRSDFGSLDFGRETDVGLSWSFREGASVRLQHARYSPGAGQVAPTIHKTWLTLTYTF